MEHGPFEDVFPIKHVDIPASYVSLPEGILEYYRIMRTVNERSSSNSQEVDSLRSWMRSKNRHLCHLEWSEKCRFWENSHEKRTDPKWLA